MSFEIAEKTPTTLFSVVHDDLFDLLIGNKFTFQLDTHNGKFRLGKHNLETKLFIHAPQINQFILREDLSNCRDPSVEQPDIGNQ